MDPETVYEFTADLKAGSCDATACWRADAMLVALQDAAGEHATRLGAGFHTLLKQNLAWILTRTRLEIDACPTFLRPVTVRTWTGKERHGIYPRYFTFTDEYGQVFGRAVSLWALMELTDRRLVLPEESQIKLPADASPAPCRAPKSIRIPEGEPAVRSTRRPVYSELDVNRHLNNTRYLSWLCDLLPASFFETKQFASLNISYLHEIRPKDEVSLSLYRTEKGCCFTGYTGDILCFAAEAEVKDKKVIPVPDDAE